MVGTKSCQTDPGNYISLLNQRNDSSMLISDALAGKHARDTNRTASGTISHFISALCNVTFLFTILGVARCSGLGPQDSARALPGRTFCSHILGDQILGSHLNVTFLFPFKTATFVDPLERNNIFTLKNNPCLTLERFVTDADQAHVRDYRDEGCCSAVRRLTQTMNVLFTLHWFK